MNKRTTTNPKGAGRMRKLYPEQERKMLERYLAGAMPYDILSEFQISERTYFRILNRMHYGTNHLPETSASGPPLPL
jgi:hypothetical protein